MQRKGCFLENAFIILCREVTFTTSRVDQKFGLTFELRTLKTAFLHFSTCFFLKKHKVTFFLKGRRAKKGSDFLYQRAKKSWGKRSFFSGDSCDLKAPWDSHTPEKWRRGTNTDFCRLSWKEIQFSKGWQNSNPIDIQCKTILGTDFPESKILFSQEGEGWDFSV